MIFIIKCDLLRVQGSDKCGLNIKNQGFTVLQLCLASTLFITWGRTGVSGYFWFFFFFFFWFGKLKNSSAKILLTLHVTKCLLKFPVYGTELVCVTTYNHTTDDPLFSIIPYSLIVTQRKLMACLAQWWFSYPLTMMVECCVCAIVERRWRSTSLG